MDRTDALIADLTRITCEETIPVGFEEVPLETPVPETTPVDLDDEIPF